MNRSIVWKALSAHMSHATGNMISYAVWTVPRASNYLSATSGEGSVALLWHLTFDCTMSWRAEGVSANITPVHGKLSVDVTAQLFPSVTKVFTSFCGLHFSLPSPDPLFLCLFLLDKLGLVRQDGNVLGWRNGTSVGVRTLPNSVKEKFRGTEPSLLLS